MSKVYRSGTNIFDVYECKVAKEDLVFGIELEYNFLANDKKEFNEIADSIYNFFNQRDYKVILKTEPSLELGCEIVTLPDSVDKHLEVFKVFWKEVDNILVSDRSEGFNIHVNRSALSEEIIERLKVFIYSPYNKNEIIEIAGRPETCWAEYKDRGTRYEALNLKNEDTIEFRMFRNPSNYLEFAYRLEFVKALIEFTTSQYSNYTDEDWSGVNFWDFVQWLYTTYNYQTLETYIRITYSIQNNCFEEDEEDIYS